MLKVFLSHLATHREFAGRLKKSLREFGISLFVAHDDIEPTAQWETEILTALSSCDALIALLHPEFHASNWTDQEIGYAMGRGIPVFSVRLGQVPYGFIGRFQAFNGNGKSQKDLATELFEVYCRHKQTQEQMSAVLIGLFEQSNSFADAKTRMNYLENLETWQPSFSESIKAAIENNSQISHSFGVPERVKRLIAHWGTKLMDK